MFVEKLMCFVLGAVAMGIAILMCKRPKKDDEVARLRRENGWLKAALADKGIEVYTFLREAQQRADFIPTWEPEPLSWRKRFAVACVLVGVCATPVVASLF